MGGNFFLSEVLYHYLPAVISHSCLAKHTGRSEDAVSCNSHRDRSTTNPLVQWLPHWDSTAVSWAVNSQTRETFWTEMLLEHLPCFPEITVAEAHRGEGREDLEATGKWHPALFHWSCPAVSTPKDTREGTSLGSSKSWVLLIHSGN